MKDQGNVSCVEGAFLWVVDVMSANVRVLYGVAGGVHINGEGGSCMVKVPAVAEADDCVN